MPPHFRKTLKLAQSYVGKDTLTQDELLHVAAIDFAAPAVQEKCLYGPLKPISDL